MSNLSEKFNGPSILIKPGFRAEKIVNRIECTHKIFRKYILVKLFAYSGTDLISNYRSLINKKEDGNFRRTNIG